MQPRTQRRAEQQPSVASMAAPTILAVEANADHRIYHPLHT